MVFPISFLRQMCQKASGEKPVVGMNTTSPVLRSLYPFLMGMKSS